MLVLVQVFATSRTSFPPRTWQNTWSWEGMVSLPYSQKEDGWLGRVPSHKCVEPLIMPKAFKLRNPLDFGPIPVPCAMEHVWTQDSATGLDGACCLSPW